MSASVPNSALSGSDPTSNAGARNTANQRGRGRGNRRNQNKARNDINEKAPPKSLKDMVHGILQLERGNAHVEVDLDFIKRISDVYRKVITSVQLQRDRTDANGDPLEVQYLAYGLASGISLATARKYYLATPESQMALVTEFEQLEKLGLSIPTGVIPYLDLLGKVSYNDLNIRIKYNELVIKRSLLTALQLLSVNQDFLNDYVPNTNTGGNNQIMLQRLQTAIIDQVLFYDEASAKYMKDKVKQRLKVLLSRNLTGNVIDPNTNQPVQGFYSIPQINVDTAARVQILAWLGRLNPAIHSDTNDANYFTQVLSCGIALLAEKSWFRDTTRTMDTVDVGFNNIQILQQVTVLQFVNACEFRHINEFIDPGNFQTYYQGAFAYYSVNIAPRLRSFVKMADQGKSSLGSPAQLVYVQDEDLVDVNTTNDNGFEYRGHAAKSRDAYCMVKFEVADTLVRSAMARITKDVELGSDYQIIYDRHLVPLLNENISLDNILNVPSHREFNF